MVKADGTKAKEIAIYFLDMTQDRYTPAMVAKTIIQAKSLLTAGYKVDEIKETIDYIINKTNVDMYSLGYVSSAINDVLKTINTDKTIKAHKEMLDKFNEHNKDTEEVDIDVESQTRNREKLSGFGNESRKREKSDFDMLKE